MAVNKTDTHTCTECSDFLYGYACEEQCQCVRNNSESCDRKSGACRCKAGWEGERCEQDVDECERGVTTCSGRLEVCHNTAGGAVCLCRPGAARDKDGHCLESTSVSCSLHIEVELQSDFNETDTTSDIYTSLMDQAKVNMLAIFVKVPGVLDIIILAVRRGSLIVEFEVILDKRDGGADLANKLASIKEISWNNVSTEAAVHVNGRPVTGMSACDLLTAMGSCQSQCDETGSGDAVCRAPATKVEIWKIIVGVAVGVPCLAIVIGLVACIVLRKKKHKKGNETFDDSLTTYDYLKDPSLTVLAPHSSSAKSQWVDNVSVYSRSLSGMQDENPYCALPRPVLHNT